MPFVLAHVNTGPEIPNTAGGMLSLCLVAVAGPCTGLVHVVDPIAAAGYQQQ